MPNRRPLALFVLAGALVAPALASQSQVAQENLRRLEETRREVEQGFVIGPGAAGELGYRVAWQTRIPPQGIATLRLARAIGEGIFALDTRNGVIRLRPTDGEQLWRVSIANPLDIFRSAQWVETPVASGRGDGRLTLEPRFALSTDLDCWLLDAGSGSLVSRQRFAKLPSTPPMPVGKFFVYGTLGGHIVWHQFLVGQEWRANSVDSPIRAPLAHGLNRIVAASDRGMVICLEEETARRRWVQRCFGGVSAAPAIADNRVYVASHDQYLWCFDIGNGDVVWKYFTESPLRTPPFPIPDAVLQSVPTEGLVCLAADAGGRPGGEVRWTNRDATGTPKGMLGDSVALWDDEKRILTRIDANRGSTLAKLHLPQVADIQFVRAGSFDGDILATSGDGRIVRLVPQRAAAPVAEGRRNTPTEPAPAKAPGASR